MSGDVSFSSTPCTGRAAYQVSFCQHGVLQIQEHRFFQQLSAVFGKGFNLDVFFVQKIFAKTVMLQLLEGLSQQKSRMFFVVSPDFVFTKNFCRFFGWDLFQPMVQQPYPSVAKAPSPAVWAYPAQVPTERDLILT